DRLLSSLERQTHRDFRVLLADQNGDDRLAEVLAGHGSLDIQPVRAPRGLSRARNVALGLVQADVVAFPDDDCVLPDDLLARVAQRFDSEDAPDGITGRAADAHGRSSTSWPRDATVLTRENLWNRAISFTIFLRAAVVANVGPFDERLGLGASAQWSSGEEIDYLVRALDGGARIEYDPSVGVVHEGSALSAATLRAVAARDGASIGY